MPRDDTAQQRRDGDSPHVEDGIDDVPDLAEAVPLGRQHPLAMFLSAVALSLVIAGVIGLGTDGTAFIVQMALLVAGGDPEEALDD